MKKSFFVAVAFLLITTGHILTAQSIPMCEKEIITNKFGFEVNLMTKKGIGGKAQKGETVREKGIVPCSDKFLNEGKNKSKQNLPNNYPISNREVYGTASGGGIRVTGNDLQQYNTGRTVTATVSSGDWSQTTRYTVTGGSGNNSGTGGGGIKGVPTTGTRIIRH